MAKQRHAVAIPDEDSDKTFAEHSGGHSIHYHKRKPSSTWFVFVLLSCLIFLVFFLNVFKFEIVSSFYSGASTPDHGKDNLVQERKNYCEYVEGGPLFFNLRTSLGVSYEGGHW